MGTCPTNSLKFWAAWSSRRGGHCCGPPGANPPAKPSAPVSMGRSGPSGLLSMGNDPSWYPELPAAARESTRAVPAALDRALAAAALAAAATAPSLAGSDPKVVDTPAADAAPSAPSASSADSWHSAALVATACCSACCCSTCWAAMRPAAESAERVDARPARAASSAADASALRAANCADASAKLPAPDSPPAPSPAAWRPAAAPAILA
mmetsp:Transcript_16571/g.49594  ORF Transcript_16571/g.49594 Transcript_16571/m.49594 type:complete len:210 (-) Transcript_16571:1455-2084(-)